MLARSYDEFYAMGVGSYLWTRTNVNGNLVRTLLLKVPDLVGGNKFGVVLRIFPRRSQGDWSESGQIKGWDGNEEFPTFTPSIWHDKPNGWHGFLERGKLREC